MTPKSERELFEAWAVDKGWSVARGYKGDNYHAAMVREMWIAWQAARDPLTLAAVELGHAYAEYADLNYGHSSEFVANKKHALHLALAGYQAAQKERG